MFYLLRSSLMYYLLPCVQRHAPHLLRGKIGGSSAGALAALAIICDIPMVEVKD